MITFIAELLLLFVMISLAQFALKNGMKDVLSFL